MTTETLTLADFLLARIAEDEAAVSDIPPDARGDRAWTHPDCAAAHIGYARMLAECEAKRRIVGRIETLKDVYHHMDAHAALVILGALALPYADHPDYRDEWRP